MIPCVAEQVHERLERRIGRRRWQRMEETGDIGCLPFQNLQLAKTTLIFFLPTKVLMQMLFNAQQVPTTPPDHLSPLEAMAITSKYSGLSPTRLA